MGYLPSTTCLVGEGNPTVNTISTLEIWARREGKGDERLQITCYRSYEPTDAVFILVNERSGLGFVYLTTRMKNNMYFIIACLKITLKLKHKRSCKGIRNC